MKVDINGEELLIGLGSFEEGYALFKALARALKGNKINLPDNITKDLSKIQINGIFDMILSIISDDEIEECLFTCAKRCSIGVNRDHVDKDYFNKPENREKYIPIMTAIAKENLSPFLKGITSSLKPQDIQGITNKILKQK